MFEDSMIALFVGKPSQITLQKEKGDIHQPSTDKENRRMRSPPSDIIPSAPPLPSGSQQNGSPQLNSQRPKQHHSSQDNNGNINQQFQRQSVAYNSEYGDQGTAQFIKTNTVIATNVFKDTYSNSNSLHNNNNNNNNNNNTNNNNNNNIWISSNLGQVREESLERSGLLQVLQTRRISEKKRSLQQHAFDASMYRSVHFLPLYLLLLSIDSVVLFVQRDNDTTSYETCAVTFLVALLLAVGTLFLIISHKYSVQLKQKLLYFQKYILIFSIITQSAYLELFLQCLKKTNNEIEENRLASVRVLNMCLLNWLFCTISQSQLVSSTGKILLILHISLRFIFISNDNNSLIYKNISEIVLLAMYSLYQFLNIFLILKISYNNRRNPHRFSSANNIQRDKGVQMLANDDLTDNPKHHTSNHQNNTNSNNNNGSLPMTLSNLPLINRLSSKHHQDNQSNLLNLQASNLLQPVSYNSLNGSMEKPPIESAQALVNSKRPPLFFQNLGQDPIPQTNGGDNDRQRQQFPSNSMMPNIPESDPENEFSKQAGSLNREQNKQGSGSMTNILSNRYQPHYNTPQSSQSNNQSSTIEQKALIDQLIEVDGVLVFEQDTQALVYANQNILNLLETDHANVLDELQQLKHLTEEKTNSKDVDSFNSNLLKPSFKKEDSGGTLMANSTPVVGLQTGNQKTSKMNSNPILNQVIEEDENEQDFCNIHKDKRFKQEAESPQFPHHKHTHTTSNGQPIQSHSNKNENSYNIDQKNNSSKIITENNENMNDGKNPLSSEKSSKKSFLIPQSNLTIPHYKKKETGQQQQQHLTKGLNNNSGYSTNLLGSFEVLADEQVVEESNPLKNQTKKTESIFKPFFQSQVTSPHSQNQQQQQQQQYSNIYMSDFLNQTPQQDQYFQGVKNTEGQELQFPSFLSSIANLTRKNTNHTNPLNNNNYGSITTLERERGNSTLKDLMDDVRSKSGTLFQQRKSVNIGAKKTLHTRRQQQLMSYSSQPEVIIGNMILYKEDSSRLFLAKYSMIEHAGKILHIVSIRDLSNDVFEMILERQSNQLIEELYFHLNLAGISGILNRAFIQLKESKRGMDKQDYIRIVRPLRIHLRLFASLLGDVNDVRYLQLKTFHLNIDYFDLSSELNRARKTTELLRPDILLSSYVDKSIPVQILNDRARVSQILQNLLVNTCRVLSGTKIFLKAKLCSSNESLVKIVIQNREIEKTQKEAILKAFSNQNNLADTNPLGYHLFVCNLLARHVSNHKKSLQLLTNNPQYLKFKFYIYLFNSPSNTTTTNINHANNIDGMYQGSSKQAHSSTSASQLSVTPRQFSSNQQANIQQYNIDVKQSSSKNYLNSLSHFDDERFEMANQVSARNEKKEQIDGIQEQKEKKLSDQQQQMQKLGCSQLEKVEEISEKVVVNLVKKDSGIDYADGGGEIEEQAGGNQLKMQGSSNSLFSGDTELSENLHSIKLKDIDEMHLQMPIKSIGDLPPFRAGYTHSKEQL